MCLRRGGNEVHAKFSDEFMTKAILESIGMNNAQIFYDHFHLKLNLGKSSLCKWNILHPIIESIFRAPSNEILEILFKKVTDDCNSNTKCFSSLVELMEKNLLGIIYYW